jgi:archaellum biogenesis ATPase FlaH
MTVVRLMVQYHEFGWAMKKLMGRITSASSQREFAEKMTSEGYPVGQQLISDYMRLKTEDVDGEELEIHERTPR